MHIAGEEQLKKALSDGINPGVFFVFGSESYLKKHYCSRIISRFDDDTGFNLQQFDSSADMQMLYEAVCQMPFMSEQKCVSLCDFDFEALDEKGIKLLEEAIDSVGKHCVLLIWFNTANADIGKTKTKRLLEHIEKSGGIIARLDKKSSTEIAKILCNGASKRLCKMDIQTARYMMEQCGDDLTNLVSELDKLCSFAGNGTAITTKHIDQVCIRTVDVKAYQLGTAIIGGKTVEAMALLDDLFYINYEPELILGAIVSPFADMCRVYIKKDKSLSQIASDFSYGKRDFVLKNALSCAEHLGYEKLKRCFDLLNDCDRSVKSSVTSPVIALEQLVVSLCQLTRRR